MSSPLFIGLATALVTPFTHEGVDYDALTHLLEAQLNAGVSAMVVCGTTGEAATLSQEEKNRILTTAVEITAGKAKIIAGIGGNNTTAAADAAKTAAALGADGVMLSTPYYNKANESGIIRHFTQVADQSPVPMIVYNVPGRTAVHCTDKIYAALADHPMICGIKEASGDLSLASRTMTALGNKLTVWSGNDDQTLALMALGAKGVISVASNIIPEQMKALCDACLKQDFTTAQSIHRKYQVLFDTLFSDVNPIPIKTAMNLLGICPGELRLPLCNMENNAVEKLLLCLKQLSLIH